MGFDYSVVRDRKFYDFIVYPGRLVAKIWFKLNCVGLENVPKDGAFILSCNHIHFVDPGLLIAKCPRKIHFMGKNEAFQKKPFAWLLTHLNTFPVSRSRSDKAAVDYAVKLIETNHVIGIFPEGTRSKDLKPKEPKAGVALIAKQTHADVLPASLYCERKKGFRRKVTMRFGELIKYEELGITEDGSTRELREAASLIMDRTVKLWEEGHCK